MGIVQEGYDGVVVIVLSFRITHTVLYIYTNASEILQSAGSAGSEAIAA